MAENRIVLDAEGNQVKELPVEVMDASFIAGAILSGSCQNESAEACEYISGILEKNGQIYVPQLFWYEIGNILLNKSKLKKNGDVADISEIQLMEMNGLLSELPIYTDSIMNLEVRQRIMRYAKDFGLTYYDASYLELALRNDIPLKTFDRALKEAYDRCSAD